MIVTASSRIVGMTRLLSMTEDVPSTIMLVAIISRSQLSNISQGGYNRVLPHLSNSTSVVSWPRDVRVLCSLQVASQCGQDQAPLAISLYAATFGLPQLAQHLIDEGVDGMRHENTVDPPAILRWLSRGIEHVKNPIQHEAIIECLMRGQNITLETCEGDRMALAK